MALIPLWASIGNAIASPATNILMSPIPTCASSVVGRRSSVVGLDYDAIAMIAAPTNGPNAIDVVASRRGGFVYPPTTNTPNPTLPTLAPPASIVL